MRVELELAVSYLCSFLVGSGGVDLGAAEDESHLDGFVLYGLERSTDIDAQLSELLHVVIIYEIDRLQVRAVEDNSHDSLTSSDRTISLDMYLINTNSLPFSYKGIKDILTEVFTFNDYLFLFGVSLGVKCG